MEERGTLRSYLRTLAGATGVTRERAGRLMASLAARGEIRARDIQQVTMELVQRSQHNRRELARLVQKEVQRRRRTEDEQPGASKP